MISDSAPSFMVNEHAKYVKATLCLPKALFSAPLYSRKPTENSPIFNLHTLNTSDSLDQCSCFHPAQEHSF